MPPNRPLSWHRLGPRDMSFEAKRFRHVAVAIPKVRVSRGIAVSPRQQSPQPQQQDVVQNKRIRCGRATAGATRWRCVAALNNAPRPQIPRYGLSRTFIANKISPRHCAARTLDKPAPPGNRAKRSSAGPTRPGLASDGQIAIASLPSFASLTIDRADRASSSARIWPASRLAVTGRGHARRVLAGGRA